MTKFELVCFSGNPQKQYLTTDHLTNNWYIYIFM